MKLTVHVGNVRHGVMCMVGDLYYILVHIYRKVKAKLHAVREHIDDLVDEVDCKANPLCEEAMRCSKDYNDFNLGYRILFCSLLQVR